MSTQKEIFQQNLNNIFEQINAKLGTNGAMTIAEMRTALENTNELTKVVLPTARPYLSGPYKAQPTGTMTDSNIYKVTLSEIVTINSTTYYVLFKLNFKTNTNWRYSQRESSRYITDKELYCIDGTELRFSVLYTIVDNVMYFVTDDQDIYVETKGCIILPIPILCETNPPATKGTFSSMNIYKTTKCWSIGAPNYNNEVAYLDSPNYKYALQKIDFYIKNGTTLYAYADYRDISKII